MYLMRVSDLRSEIPVVSADGTSYADARPVTLDFDPDFFGGGGLSATREALEAGGLPAIDIGGMRVGAPICRPAAIICIGQNYAAHAAESQSPPPTQPLIFLKHPSTLRGPMDGVQIPPGASQVDWEVELAVVIGATARYLATEREGLACVAGYAVANDLSERAFQIERSGGQWSKGKCCEDFLPLGPVLAVGEIADRQSLRLRSWVNGQPRQDSNTADMIFPVGEIVRHLSHFLVLSPGDVILTGTPQGVALSGRFPYLSVGDTVDLEIGGLGRQQQKLVPAKP